MMTYKVNETLTISVSFTKFIILMLCDFVLDHLLVGWLDKRCLSEPIAAVWFWSRGKL